MPSFPSRDWTPAVILSCSTLLGVAGFSWVLDRWQRQEEQRPGMERAERPAPAEVVLWVGESGDGSLKYVLTSVWGDAGPDAEHDAALRAGLGLASDAALSWYRLLLFNRSERSTRIMLHDGQLVVDGPGGRAQLTSLAALVRQGTAKPSRALESVLHGLGALREEVDMPAHSALPVMVCLDRRVDLSTVVSIAGGDGTAFRRRRIPRGELQRLLADPDEALVRDL